MHIRAKLPIFVPAQYRGEIEKLSKAALMDIAWDYAVRCANGDASDTTTMEEFRHTASIVLLHRSKGG